MHEDGLFEEDVAARYDETSAEMFDPEIVGPAVDFLVGLANGGAAMELGIGTGRIALPLAARGVPVSGIDLSAAMLRRLRAKPGGDAIDVTVGDIASIRVPGSFSLVYIVWNTMLNLTTQDAQVACFRSAADLLEPNGSFVVEVDLPDLRRLPPGETIRPFLMTETRLGFDEYDVADQNLTSHHLYFSDGQVRRVTMPFRFVWPSELDLMAQLAGLRRRERWSGWQRQPFTSDSRTFIGIWQKPAG